MGSNPAHGKLFQKVRRELGQIYRTCNLIVSNVGGRYQRREGDTSDGGAIPVMGGRYYQYTAPRTIEKWDKCWYYLDILTNRYMYPSIDHFIYTQTPFDYQAITFNGQRGPHGPRCCYGIMLQAICNATSFWDSNNSRIHTWHGFPGSRIHGWGLT